MPMSAETITTTIKAALPDAEILLQDLAGDGDHWQVTVISSAFAGLPRVRQHKLVMDAFGSDMGTTLHALSIKTQTPDDH
jgi:Stress-induced morphogen (activity unknown)